jgi:DNA-binding NarL/FixJ family response regulator
MSDDYPIRVLLVDDHDLVRAGFRALLDLEPGFEVVGEAAEGEGAVRAARALRPDVICMDVQMPVMDGIEATRTLLAADSSPAGSGGADGDSTDGGSAVDAQVIVLTTFRDDRVVQAALRAGASGFVLKNSPPAVLVDSIRTVHEGDALIDPQVTMSVIAAMRRGDSAQEWDGAVVRDRPGPPAPRVDARTSAPPAEARTGAAPAGGGHGVAAASGAAGSATQGTGTAEAGIPELDRLTSREREVLGGMARGLGNAAIAAELFVSEATVKTHVSHVLQKLGVRDRIHAVIFAYEHGVVAPER